MEVAVMGFVEDFCYGSQFIKNLPNLKSFMCRRKFENKFFKINPLPPPLGVLLICKLPSPNGSYPNGVYGAFWVLTTTECEF